MWICQGCGRVWSDVSVKNSPIGKRCLCGGTLRKIGNNEAKP
jgi:hypothetical protein